MEPDQARVDIYKCRNQPTGHFHCHVVVRVDRHNRPDRSSVNRRTQIVVPGLLLLDIPKYCHAVTFLHLRSVDIGNHPAWQSPLEPTHPTLPSSEMPTSFCASTANSIGSCCSPSRQKPLTISATASSCGMPRCRQ